MMKTYPQELKEALVAKMCMPGGPTALQISKETGISNVTLSIWKRKFGSGEHLKVKWSFAEKHKILLETQSMTEEELGAFLRSKGLHSTDLDDWKLEINSALAGLDEKRKPGRPRKDPELLKVREENKKLRRDLRRKEKALAEQTALVILKKKMDEYWGEDEDDESL